MANAPHIPVHLGAMQYAVQWQVYIYTATLIISKVYVFTIQWLILTEVRII